MWVILVAAVALLVPASTLLPQDLTSTSTEEKCLQWVPNPEWANARSSTLSVKVATSSPEMPDETVEHNRLEQHGVGDKVNDTQRWAYQLDDPSGVFGTLVAFNLSHAHDEVHVREDPGFGESEHTSRVAISELTLLDGAVEADLIRPAAHTWANSSRATLSSQNTTFQDLRVEGEPIEEVKPWQYVDLSDEFGDASYVMLYERITYIHVPTKPVNDGWAADLVVNAIHVYLSDVDPSEEGEQTVEILVGQARGHSDFPMQPPCGPTQRTSGHGTVLEAQVPPDHPLKTGHAQIEATGGHEDTYVASLDAVDTKITAVEAESAGAWEHDRTWAQSHAGAADLCLLEGRGTCLVEADAVQSHARASADAAEATAEGSVKLVGLQVAGQPVCQPAPLEDACAPPANTAVAIPGVGTVVLNEQVRNNTDPADCEADLTVRALHFHAAEGTAFHDVVVAESHAGALYC